MSEAQQTPAAVVPKLVLASIAQLCTCARCSRMAGFYRVVWEVGTDIPGQQIERLRKHWLFGKVICAN
jgi:hypothetical protein